MLELLYSWFNYIFGGVLFFVQALSPTTVAGPYGRLLSEDEAGPINLIYIFIWFSFSHCDAAARVQSNIIASSAVPRGRRLEMSARTQEKWNTSATGAVERREAGERERRELGRQIPLTLAWGKNRGPCPWVWSSSVSRVVRRKPMLSSCTACQTKFWQCDVPRKNFSLNKIESTPVPNFILIVNLVAFFTVWDTTWKSLCYSRSCTHCTPGPVSEEA